MHYISTVDHHILWNGKSEFDIFLVVKKKAVILFTLDLSLYFSYKSPQRKVKKNLI